MALSKRDEKLFVKILSSDGTLRLEVPDGTEGAVKRDFETSDGTKGTKTELIFDTLSGMITDVGFQEGDYGTNLQITISDDQGSHILSVNTGQNFGEDIMKKLPNVDFAKPISFKPYSFEDDKKKLRKGVTMLQDEVKLQNFFYDPKEEKNINGFPNPKGDTKKYSKDKWKAYFIDARIFLIDYITENILPKFEIKA